MHHVWPGMAYCVMIAGPAGLTHARCTYWLCISPASLLACSMCQLTSFDTELLGGGSQTWVTPRACATSSNSVVASRVAFRGPTVLCSSACCWIAVQSLSHSLQAALRGLRHCYCAW